MEFRRTGPSRLFALGVAQVAVPGEKASGDLHVVQPFPDGMLVAAIDGVGHGKDAAAAAELAAATLRRHAQESVVSLVRRCHRALAGTRGVVLSVASFNVAEDTMTWIGIGNVEGVLIRADAETEEPNETILLLRGGIVGLELPLLKASVVSLLPRDLLIFSTDGVRNEFVPEVDTSRDPQRLADRILARHARGTDDGLVLVARYLRARTGRS